MIFVDRLQFSSELNKLVAMAMVSSFWEYLLLSIIVIKHSLGKQGTEYYIQASKIYKHCCNHPQQTRLKINNKTIQDQIIQLGHFWCKKTCSRRMSKVLATVSNYVTAPLSGRQYTTIYSSRGQYWEMFVHGIAIYSCLLTSSAVAILSLSRLTNQYINILVVALLAYIMKHSS